jgi:hypothetical protein
MSHQLFAAAYEKGGSLKRSLGMVIGAFAIPKGFALKAATLC